MPLFFVCEKCSRPRLRPALPRRGECRLCAYVFFICRPRRAQERLFLYLPAKKQPCALPFFCTTLQKNGRPHLYSVLSRHKESAPFLCRPCPCACGCRPSAFAAIPTCACIPRCRDGVNAAFSHASSLYAVRICRRPYPRLHPALPRRGECYLFACAFFACRPHRARRNAASAASICK